MLLCLLLLGLFLLPEIGASPLNRLQHLVIQNETVEISDCRKILRELSSDEWEHYRKIQDVYSNARMTSLEKIQALEKIVEEFRDLEEIFKGNKSYMTAYAHNLFTIYTITDSQKDKKTRVQNLVDVMNLSAHRYEDKAIAVLAYYSIVDNWDETTSIIENSFGAEEKKLLIKSFRVLNEHSEFIAATHEKKQEMVLSILGCYLGAAIRKVIYHEKI